MKEKRKYTKEFKKDTISLLMSSRKTMTEIANDLGIHVSLLTRWKKELKADGENAFPGNGNPKDKEIFELKCQLAHVTEERDILKKAIAIFSKK